MNLKPEFHRLLIPEDDVAWRGQCSRKFPNVFASSDESSPFKGRKRSWGLNKAFKKILLLPVRKRGGLTKCGLKGRKGSCGVSKKNSKEVDQYWRDLETKSGGEETHFATCRQFRGGQKGQNKVYFDLSPGENQETLGDHQNNLHTTR